MRSMTRPSLWRVSLMTLYTSIASALAPANFSVINTQVRECNYTITVQPSANRSSIDYLFDTSLSKADTPDSLAWTDSLNANSSLCVVCASLKWDEKLYGQISSIDYDFWHRMDPGLLEAVVSHAYRETDTTEEWFETSFIYGSEETVSTQHVQTSVANASEPLLLDHTKADETFCVRTTFSVYNRVGVEGASGEISRKSVFRQSLNVDWKAEKPAR